MVWATAAQQNVPDAVIATEADLHNALGFEQMHCGGPEKQGGGAHNGKALLVEVSEGEVAGMAFYFTIWVAKSGICLEDLYVFPKYRCRGYARLLVQGVAKKAEELRCSRIEWLCYKQNHRALTSTEVSMQRKWIL